VVGGGGADSILQFQLGRGDDKTKRYRKIKRRQRAHLGSVESKRDTMRQRGNASRRRGDTEEGKGRRRR
jgi:hypothetical protein